MKKISIEKINAEIEVLKRTITAIDLIKDIVPTFDGKQMTKRYTTAIYKLNLQGFSNARFSGFCFYDGYDSFKTIELSISPDYCCYYDKNDGYQRKLDINITLPYAVKVNEYGYERIDAAKTINVLNLAKERVERRLNSLTEGLKHTEEETEMADKIKSLYLEYCKKFDYDFRTLTTLD